MGQDRKKEEKQQQQQKKKKKMKCLENSISRGWERWWLLYREKFPGIEKASFERSVKEIHCIL